MLTKTGVRWHTLPNVHSWTMPENSLVGRPTTNSN